MRSSRLDTRHFPTALVLALFALLSLAPPAAQAQQKPQSVRLQKPGLPRPRRLDRGIELRRDPATGELREARRGNSGPRAHAPSSTASAPAAALRARVDLVEVNCAVVAPDGTHVRGLGRDDFRLFEDGVEQPVAHFDASGEPASIVLVLDLSPSIFRELERMKAAARTLARHLSPLDEVAVVAFARETLLLLPFSRDRALLERAISSPELARVANANQSNIYEAVYLTVRELFRGRAGRKAIVLLTDGQDSDLGLSWDPASAMPQPLWAAPQAGENANRLTFEDVARALATAGVEVYVVSTQPRPKAMTDAWLDAHRTEMLVTPAARKLGMAHYSLYLAELVRRAGGRLYFLREMGTLSEVYRRIAETLSAQYTLGYYPTGGLARPGWRALRVELSRRSASAEGAPSSPRQSRGRLRESGADNVRIAHRVAYYVPAAP